MIRKSISTISCCLLLISCRAFSQSVEELVHMGAKAYDAHDFKSGVMYIEKAVSLHPGLPNSTYNLLAQCYEGLGSHAKAVSIYEPRLDQWSMGNLLVIIDRCMTFGDYDFANRVVRKGIERFPQDSSFPRLRVTVAKLDILKAIAQEPKESEKIVQLYEKAIELDSSDIMILIPYQDVLFQRGDLTMAARINDRILRADSTQYESCVQMAKMYMTVKDLERSASAWERAMRIYPGLDLTDYVDVCIDLGAKYEREGKLAEAIRSLSRADSLRQSDPTLKLALSKVLYRNGDIPAARAKAGEALERFRQSAEGSKADGTLFIQTGSCYLIRGDLIGAEIEFEKYIIHTDPQNREGAVKALQQLADQHIDAPEAKYLMGKLFSGVEPDSRRSSAQIIPPVRADTVPPVIIIQNPPLERGMKPVTSPSYSIRVSGVAYDDHRVSRVWVGGEYAVLSALTAEEARSLGITGSGVKFSANPLLSPGDNVVEVRAYDLSDNVSVRSFTVNRTQGQMAEKLLLTGKLPQISAVVVGISTYQNKDIQLQFAERDAMSFNDFLRKPEGGEVPGDRIDVLTNRNATRAEVIKAIIERLRRASEDDMVIIYLACHGLPDDIGKEMYFLGWDADPDNLAGTAISRDDLQKYIFESRAKKIVVFADACHSGSLSLSPAISRRGGDANLTNKLLKQIAKARDGVAILSASSSSEYSREGKDWGGGHGVFTHYLLQGLKGAADSNNDGYVSLREIYDYVYRNVIKDTEGKQHPDLQGTLDSDLKISVVR